MSFQVGDMVDVIGPPWATFHKSRTIGPWPIRHIMGGGLIALKEISVDLPDIYPASSLRLHVPNQVTPPTPYNPFDSLGWVYYRDGAPYRVHVESVQLSPRPPLYREMDIEIRGFLGAIACVPSSNNPSNTQDLADALAEVARLKQEIQNAQTVAGQQDAAYASLERDRDRLQQQVDGLRRELMPKPDMKLRNTLADAIGEINRRMVETKTGVIPDSIRTEVLAILTPKERA